MEPGKLEWASSRAFERITEAYVALDAQWRCTYVNAAAAALLGRRAESLLGKRIWTEFPQPEARPFREACEQAMAEQRPRTVETWLAPVGRWFEGCIYPAPDGLTVRVQEITERKREAQRLQAQRRLLNQAQQLAMVGSWSWDVAADRVHWRLDENKQPVKYEGDRLKEYLAQRKKGAGRRISAMRRAGRPTTGISRRSMTRARSRGATSSPSKSGTTCPMRR